MQIKRLITILSLALLVGCGSAGKRKLRMASPDFRPRTQEKEMVVLAAAGSSGQYFDADLMIDGKQQKFQVQTPDELHFEACIIYGTIRKTGGAGELSFTIRPDTEKPTRTVGLGKLRGRGDRLQFGYHDGQVEVIH